MSTRPISFGERRGLALNTRTSNVAVMSLTSNVNAASSKGVDVLPMMVEVR